MEASGRLAAHSRGLSALRCGGFWGRCWPPATKAPVGPSSTGSVSTAPGLWGNLAAYPDAFSTTQQVGKSTNVAMASELLSELGQSSHCGLAGL